VTLLRRAALVVVLSGVAIEVHELGHRAVFWLTGTPARMSFQRVDPTVPVSHALWLWGRRGLRREPRGGHGRRHPRRPARHPRAL